MTMETDPLLTDKTTEIKETSIIKNALKKLNRVIIPLTILYGVICNMNKLVLVYAANQFCKALGLSYSEYGTGISVYYITFALFQVPSNIILTKIGAPKWLSFLALGWGITSLMLTFIQNTAQYYTLRIILGAFESGAIPGLFYYLLALFPVGFEYALSTTMAMSGFIAPVTTFLAAGLLSLDGILGFEGWKWLFLIESLIPIFFALIIFYVLPENIQKTKFLNNREKSELMEIEAIRGEKKKSNVRMNVWKSVLNIMSIYDFWIISIGSILQSAAREIVHYYITLIIANILTSSSNSDAIDDSNSDDIKTCSSSTTDVLPTLLSSIPYVGMSIAMYVIGVFFNWIPNRSHFMVYLYLASAFSLMGLASFENSIYIGMTLLTISFSLIMAGGVVVISILASKISSTEYAIGIAMFNMISTVGAVMGPWAAGYIIEAFGFSGQIISCSCVMAMAAVLFIFVKDNQDHYKFKKLSKNEIMQP